MRVRPRCLGAVVRLHMGSVAHNLAHPATRPLAIVPAPGARGEVDRIVVGVDGSDGSTQAVRWCAEVARATGAEVVAVYAFEPMVEWVLESHPRSWYQAAKRELEGPWTAPLHDEGIPVRTRIIENIHPVRALADAVEEGEDRKSTRLKSSH